MKLKDCLKLPLPTHLLPEIEQAVLLEVKERYREQIDPEIWKSQFDLEEQGDYSQEFMVLSFEIVENVLSEFTQKGKIAELMPNQIEYIKEVIWDKAQSYWYEYAPELNSALSFMNSVYQSSIKEIENLFPNCSIIFGANTRDLLIDLSFQYRLYNYSKISKPDLIDLRRMINISGQVVESVFEAKFFPNEGLRLGKILDTLSKTRKDPNSPLKRLSKKEISGFLTYLDTINKIRNDYSHGTSNQKNIENDFIKCLEALIDKPNGLLFTLARIHS